MVPAVNNSEDMYERAYRAAEIAAGEDKIIDSNPSLASEDFAVYGEQLPSFFYWVGSGEPGGKNAPWHDNEFKIGKAYFNTAVPLLAASAAI